jgi:hypothetical protein
MASGELHAPAALPTGKESLVSTIRRLGEPWNWFRQYGEVKVLIILELEL